MKLRACGFRDQAVKGLGSGVYSFALGVVGV